MPIARFIFFALIVVGQCGVSAIAQDAIAPEIGKAASPPPNPIGDLFRGVGNFLSNIASPHGRKLNELIEKKQYDEAATLYEAQKEFFSGQGVNYENQLKILAEALNATREPALKDVLVRLSEIESGDHSGEAEWPSIKRDLASAHEKLNEYESVFLLKSEKYRSALVTDVRSSTMRIEANLDAAALDAFARYDNLGPNSFFEQYPVEVARAQLVASGLDRIWPRLLGATAAQLADFQARYSAWIPAPQLSMLGAAYVERYLAEHGQTGFFEKWAAVKKATEIGFRPGKIKEFDVAVVSLKTPEGLAAEPVLSISPDLELNFKSLDAPQIAVDPAMMAANYLVLIRMGPAEIRRKVAEKLQEASKIEVAKRTVPNPAYEVARSNLNQAQIQYNTQKLQNATTPAYGVWAGVLRGLAEGVGGVAVGKAQQELAATPPYFEEPVYQDYKFNLTKVDSAKSVDVSVWIVDRVRSGVARHDFTWTEKKTFSIAYGIDDRDPDKYSLTSKYDTEKAVDTYEKAAIPIKLSWLADQVLVATPAFSPMESEAEILANAATSLKKASSISPGQGPNEQATSTDERFNSVVVVKNPTGGLGAGFFVAPDMVLTNYHVVEGAKMAEVKLRNGTEAVGRVAKFDAGLDLALIKVTDKGPPVIFSNAVIGAGSTVEAIGHPSGLEFSMTRGIVSAVRKMTNPLVPGSREMLVIQTDAAISPGNSGGPLFIGNQVVGINTQKLVRRGVEGVGFAIHYAEALRFIQE